MVQGEEGGAKNIKGKVEPVTGQNLDSTLIALVEALELYEGGIELRLLQSLQQVQLP
jgi:hypothetical protein